MVTPQDTLAEYIGSLELTLPDDISLTDWFALPDYEAVERDADPLEMQDIAYFTGYIRGAADFLGVTPETLLVEYLPKVRRRRLKLVKNRARRRRR